MRQRGDNREGRTPDGGLSGWLRPPRESSQSPFWFWNDDLQDDEIVRQIADFEAHGVYQVIICSRLGMPHSIPFLGERHLGHLLTAARALADRDMAMMFLDEGMYASGAASGQIVAENPKLRGRGLVAVDLDALAPGTELHGVRMDASGDLSLTEEQELVTLLRRSSNGHRVAVVNTPVPKACRGIHFIEDDPARLADGSLPAEERPPSSDLLNPESVEAYIRLVYAKVADRLREFAGESFLGFFTDQPSLTGGLSPDIRPGTWGIATEVSRLLGYDITPHLLSLWFDDEPNAQFHRHNYMAACQRRFDETFHKPLYDWCDRHGLLLTGHTDTGWNLGHQRYLHIPGQDMTRCRLMPGKVPDINYAAGTYEYSAMRHLGRRQCLNEYFGAYGHENQRFDLYRWLTNRLLARGVNLLVPHAFFYSVRGPRLDECPPDVGPHSPWWGNYKSFADACARISWLNTDSRHICHVAILSRDDRIPSNALPVLQSAQVDAVFLAEEHLRLGEARVSADGVCIRDMFYRVLIVEEDTSPDMLELLKPLNNSGRLVRWEGSATVPRIQELIPVPPFELTPAPDIRLRHVQKNGFDFFIFYNESAQETVCHFGRGTAPVRFLDPEQPADDKPFPDSFVLSPGYLIVGVSPAAMKYEGK